MSASPDALPPLRLTRRGRVLARLAAGLLLAAAIVTGVLGIVRPALAGTRDEPAVRYHVVLPGETLWQIAAEVAPHADRRDVIARIVELNHLPGSGVAAGQQLALPAEQ